MEISDDKENHKIFLENDRRQKSPHAVESLLLLDNTLLCNIEPDNSIFALHTCSETYDSSQKHNVSAAQVSKGQIQNTKTSPTVPSKISQSVSPNINKWQDESLMNQVFAQFELQEEKENVLKNCSNISFDVFDTFCKEDTNSESSNVTDQSIDKTSLDEENINISCQDRLANISYLYITNFDNNTLEDSCFKEDVDKSPILKSKSKSLNEYKKPKKQLCLKNVELKSKNENINSTKCSSLFYDLPHTVKKLIQEIKGIYELYRKLQLYKSIKFKCISMKI